MKMTEEDVFFLKDKQINSHVDSPRGISVDVKGTPTEASLRTNGESKHWRWLVLVMTTFQVMINGSVNLNVGILNLAMLDTYQAGPLLTSWVMSLYVAICCLSGPLTTAVIDIFDSRVCVFISGVLALIGFTASYFVNTPELLFLTLGIASVGQGMSLVGGSVVLPFYFPTKTAMVSGVFICGSGLGSFIHPPLTQVLVDEYSLHGAFLILGAISFHSSLAAMFLRPHPSERERKRLKKESRSNGDVLKSCMENLRILGLPAFSLFMLSNMLYCSAFLSILMYLPDYLVNAMEHTEQKASKVVSLVGLGVAFSRIFSGYIANDKDIRESIVFFGLNIMSSLVCCVGPALIHLPGGPYVFCFAIGLYSGGSLAVVVPIAIKISKHATSSLGIGLCFMAQGVGFIIGPPLGAKCILLFGYDSIFYFTSLVFFLCAVSFALSCLFWSDTEHETTSALETSDNILPVEETCFTETRSPLENSDNAIVVDNTCFTETRSLLENSDNAIVVDDTCFTGTRSPLENSDNAVVVDDTCFKTERRYIDETHTALFTEL